MKEGFTPGPWIASGTNVDAGDVHVDGVRVAKCWTSTFAPPVREAEANAVLIAAAHDLLAALERILPLLRHLECTPGPCTAHRDALVEAATAAVAKAKGESR